MGRGPDRPSAVSVWVVLRLVPAALAAGRLAGEVELVETGTKAVVRDADELVAFLRGRGADGLPAQERENRGSLPSGTAPPENAPL